MKSTIKKELETFIIILKLDDIPEENLTIW